jgi:hypothetical protein
MKYPVREADISTSSISEDKRMRGCIPPLAIRLHGVVFDQRDNITFNLNK